MSFASYSSTPASNTSLNGINTAENCPAANINNAIRQIAADGKELYDQVQAIAAVSYMPLGGGAFTGGIIRDGAGAFLAHNSPSLLNGTVYTQPVATALPSSPAEGTIVLQY
jgi:hypothetical protein